LKNSFLEFFLEKSLALLIASYILFLFGCSHRQNTNTLENYASLLPPASTPGNNVKKFIASFGKKNDKLTYLAICYHYILKNWRYKKDDIGNDTFAFAEQLLENNNFIGDCEDQCSLLVAICRFLKLESRLALAHSSDTGHVWVEVLITNKQKCNSRSIKAIYKKFKDSAIIISRNDGLWLKLCPKKTEAYRVKYFIDIHGNLSKKKY